MTRECGARAESKNCEILLFLTADRRFDTKAKCPTGRASFWVKFLACSKRSDSGERCGVEKAMKSRGGLGREVLLPRFYFFALPFTLHRSPLSERLEQTIKFPTVRSLTRVKCPGIARGGRLAVLELTGT